VFSLGRRLAVALLWAGLAAPAVGSSAEKPEAPEALPSEVKAAPGDSWSSIRGKICPIEIVQSANPAATERSLRPGDVIRSPFVLSTELQRANARYGDLEVRLAEEIDRRSELETQLLTFENQQSELLAVRESEVAARRNGALMLAVAAGAIALLLVALVFLLAARQESERASVRLSEAEERYADLRQSLQALEIQLQKRMLELVGMHKGSAVSDEQISAATLPVIEMAERLKRRHAS
jgi:hypothetical protein